jgi:hypothetical protein
MRHLALFALFALLALPACSAAPRAPRTDEGEPALALAAAPDVRVLALELEPGADAWRLAGLLALPRPLLAGEDTARVQGLDEQGRELFAQAIELDVRPASSFRGGPRTAAVSAQLPAPAGLSQVRLLIPGR